MGVNVIREINRKRAVEAAQERLVPFTLEAEDLEEWKNRGVPRFPFPFIGYHLPEGWELVRVLFCDASGFGSPREPAYSPGELVRDHLVAGRAYAVVESGQFQANLGEFVREGEYPDEDELDFSGRATFPAGGILNEIQMARRE